MLLDYNTNVCYSLMDACAVREEHLINSKEKSVLNKGKCVLNMNVIYIITFKNNYYCTYYCISSIN